MSGATVDGVETVGYRIHTVTTLKELRTEAPDLGIEKPSTLNKVDLEAAIAKAAEAAAKIAREARTFDPEGMETFRCQGACGQELPVRKFPTVNGATRRGVECGDRRDCRDTRLSRR